MDDDIRQRAKIALEWLKEQRIILSQKDAAVKMGYNACVMSTILNRQGKISNKFVEKLCSLNSRLRMEWLLTGEGDMLSEIIESQEMPELNEQFDMPTLIRIIEGQTKTIGFMTGYLGRIEADHKTLMSEIASLRREVAELREMKEK